jgi:hypothetical protein
MSIFKRQKDSDSFATTPVSDKQPRRKRGRPPKNPKPDPPAPEVIPDKNICSLCKQPLTFEGWNSSGMIGFCENTSCRKWHEPQGWEKGVGVFNDFD